MDNSGLRNEIDTIISNLDSFDESEKEYTIAVNNLSKLHQVLTNGEEFELKKSRNDFDEDIRKKQLEFDKVKFETEMKQKDLDREIENKRIENQHAERMAELELNKIKAENEKKILEQNQIKSEREFKATRRRDWLIFGGKALTLFMIVGINVLMHKEELIFERDDNGIVPSRCKIYDSVVTKASETVMK